MSAICDNWVDFLASKESISTFAVVLILVGTYYISKSILLTNIGSRYWLRDKYGMSWKWRIAASFLGINERNWTLIFTSDDQLTDEQRKKVRDGFAPIKGFVFIAIGTFLQIIAIWVL